MVTTTPFSNYPTCPSKGKTTSCKSVNDAMTSITDTSPGWLHIFVNSIVNIPPMSNTILNSNDFIVMHYVAMSDMHKPVLRCFSLEGTDGH